MSKLTSPTASELFLIAGHIDLKIALTRTLNWQPLSGVSDVDKSLVATIVSELASNIIKYAQSGYVELRLYEFIGRLDIEVIATDRGPGIADIEQAMQDYFSSGGTLGLGLSGIKRIANDFEIHSVLGQGTTVLARKRINIDPSKQVLTPKTLSHLSKSEPWDPVRSSDIVKSQWVNPFEIGLCIRPYPGQIDSGDQVLALPVEEGYLLVIVDATGHGYKAHKVALMLCAAVREIASSNLPYIMNSLYQLATGTIGAAVGLAFFNINKRTVCYAGIGNTRFIIFRDKKWRAVSRDGVLGQRLPTFPEQSTSFNPGDMAIMFTDGLSESLINEKATLFYLQDANTIANNLVEVCGKHHDDASCMILKWNR